MNSGAVYRAITWHILQKRIDTSDVDRVIQAVESAQIVCRLQNNESRILIDHVDPMDYLRDDRVNENVSHVSSVPRVREIAVEKMRDCARNHDVVIEGRDIGSVVFPDTIYKFYVDASPDVRCAVVPRRGSVMKLRCVTRPILRGLFHRSSSRRMRTSSIRRI